jgi:hypothetical protein
LLASCCYCCAVLLVKTPCLTDPWTDWWLGSLVCSLWSWHCGDQVKVTPVSEGEGGGEEKRTDYGIDLEVKDLGDGTYRVEYTRTKMCVPAQAAFDANCLAWVPRFCWRRSCSHVGGCYFFLFFVRVCQRGDRVVCDLQRGAHLWLALLSHCTARTNLVQVRSCLSQ